MGKTERRRLAKEQARPILQEIDRVLEQLGTNYERRGFLAKLHRAIYERRKPLYRFKLHPNQKT